MDQQRVMNVLLNDAGSLSVLGRLDDDVLYFSKILGNLDALTSICVLARFNDPDIRCLFAFANLVLCSETLKFSVIKSRLDMESHRQSYKGVLADSFIVKHHVEEECLLVGQVVIVFNLIVNFIG